MRTLHVRGIGRVTKSPDQIEINITIITLNINYQLMMKEANEKNDKLTLELINIGFKSEDIKTVSFIVNARYENIQAIDGSYKSQFIGYEVRHHLRLVFDLDLDLLGNTLNAITRSITNPELSILFTLKNQQSVRDELLESAIGNAMHNATVIAQESGVTLGEIQNIDYNRMDGRLYSDTSFAPQLAMGMERVNIVPEDIELTDSISITFEIT